MGALACCDKRLYYPFQATKDTQQNNSELSVQPVALKRETTKKPQISSILIFSNASFVQKMQNTVKIDNEPVQIQRPPEKSPRHQTILEMDVKLQLLKKEKKKNLDRLSGKKLLTEVFS